MTNKENLKNQEEPLEKIVERLQKESIYRFESKKEVHEQKLQNKLEAWAKEAEALEKVEKERQELERLKNEIGSEYKNKLEELNNQWEDAKKKELETYQIFDKQLQGFERLQLLSKILFCQKELETLQLLSTIGLGNDIMINK